LLSIKKILLSAIIALSTLSTIQAAPVNGDDWLHTKGNQIVDKNGNPVWLTGANWFGFNTTERVFHGLWSVNLESTLKVLADRGINILRVPISTELLWEWRNGQFTATNVNGSTNPNLAGKNSLEIFDQFLTAARNVGMKVLLDVHSAEADNSGHIARLWYKGKITPEMFYKSWEWVTERYKNDDTKNNFKHACETASKRILAINPKLLVLCEGIESYPKDGVSWKGSAGTQYFNTWWGGNLRGVRDHPINLGKNQKQLVYSPHDYGPLVYKQKWFNKNFNRQTLQEDAWNDNWLFIHDENIAPLLIGEWGGFLDNGDNQKWMEALRDQIIEDRLHHTFWAVNPNSGDTGGLLKNDWLTFDEAKYAILEPTLWKNRNGKFVGLDHEVPLGSSATGVSLSEHYGNSNNKRSSKRKEHNQPAKAITVANQQAIISIKSPSHNSEVLTNERFTVDVGYRNARGYNVTFNGKTQTILNKNSVTLTAPAQAGNYPLNVRAIDNNRYPLNARTAINIVVSQAKGRKNRNGNIKNNRQNATRNHNNNQAVISIKSPSHNTSLSGNERFSVNVAYRNARGFSVTFNGRTQTILNSTSATITAPGRPGTYPLSVTAIDNNRNPLNAKTSINVVVNKVRNRATTQNRVTCTMSKPSIWPGGFTIDKIKITNRGANAISNWTAKLHFAQNMSLSSGWNAKYNGKSGHITVSNEVYNGNIGAGQSTTFGLQGSYTGNFVAPKCTVINAK